MDIILFERFFFQKTPNSCLAYAQSYNFTRIDYNYKTTRKRLRIVQTDKFGCALLKRQNYFQYDCSKANRLSAMQEMECASTCRACTTVLIVLICQLKLTYAVYVHKLANQFRYYQRTFLFRFADKHLFP